MSTEQTEAPKRTFWVTQVIGGLGLLVIFASLALGIFARPDSSELIATAEFRMLRQVLQGLAFLLIGLAFLLIDLGSGKPLGKRHVTGTAIVLTGSILPALSTWLDLIAARLSEAQAASFGPYQVPDALLDPVSDLGDMAFALDMIGVLALIAGCAIHLAGVVRQNHPDNPGRLWMREPGNGGGAR